MNSFFNGNNTHKTPPKISCTNRLFFGLKGQLVIIIQQWLSVSMKKKSLVSKGEEKQR